MPPAPPSWENPKDDWERWTVSYVHGWGRAAFERWGVKERGGGGRECGGVTIYKSV